ncbi:hypothetical protein V7799_01240 [Rhizobium laguerreae]
MSMRAPGAQYNVNRIDGRLELLLRLIADEEPDVRVSFKRKAAYF